MKLKVTLTFILCMNLVFCASSQKKLQREQENDPRYQYNMGLFYLNNGRADEAITHLEKSLRIKPNDMLTLNAIGLAHSMEGEFEKSADYYQRCLKLDPNFTEAHNNLGSVYQELGFFDRAEKEFQYAIGDFSYHSRELPHYNLARLYLLMEQNQKALDHVQKSLEINNRMVLAYNLKGKIHEKLENFVEAIKCYESALEIAPDDTNLSFNLAVAFFENDEHQKAKEIFEKIYLKVTDPEIKATIDQYLKKIR